MREEAPHTFLLADISGYSLLTELEGDEFAAELALWFAEEVAEMAEEHGAELVKRMGDAVLVRTPDAAAAIELAMRLARGERALPSMHVGVHSGPALERDGEWWGATVNVTARVADAAEDGQVLVTEAAVRAAGEQGQAGLRAFGPLKLKNVTDPVWVHSAEPARYGRLRLVPAAA
jgi:adenylate cyclase